MTNTSDAGESGTEEDMLARASNRLKFNDELRLDAQLQELPVSHEKPSKHLDYVNDGRVWLDEVIERTRYWFTGEFDVDEWRKQLMAVWMDHE